MLGMGAKGSEYRYTVQKSLKKGRSLWLLVLGKCLEERRGEGGEDQKAAGYGFFFYRPVRSQKAPILQWIYQRIKKERQEK